MSTMPTLLLLEDDQVLRSLLVEVFEDAAYQVFTAMPAGCVPGIQHAAPDIIVIGCDGCGNFEPGWQVAQMLRQVFPATTMIMLSTNTEAVQEVGRTARGCLFDAGVRKPFALADLLETVACCHRARGAVLKL